MNFEHCKTLLKNSYLDRGFENAYLLVGTKDETLFEYGINATKESIFDLASVSKVTSTTLITLRMVDAGLLNLTDPLTCFFEVVPKEKKEITIHHLLTHTSGFEPFINLATVARTTNKVVETLLDLPLAATVGEKVIYSCLGFILLGEILTKISNKSLAILSQEYVFDPLGLKETTYQPLALNNSNQIIDTEYNIDINGHLKGVVHDENARFLGLSGNAGVFSTINDLAIFSRMLLNGGVVKDERFLSVEIFEKMITNYTCKKAEGRGLGLRIYQEGEDFPGGDKLSKGSFGHTGFTGTSFFIDPKQEIFIIFLTNRVYHGRVDKGFLNIRKSLHNEIIRHIKTNRGEA